VYTVFPSYLPSYTLSPTDTTLPCQGKTCFALLYKQYISHIHLINFLFLSFFSCMCPPLSVTSFS
jgi:hypothetical protein